MTAGVNFYGDFQGLAQLRADAARSARDPGTAAGNGSQQADAAREAARQFEALFVQMMLKSMRDANAVLGKEQQDSTYQDMYDQQIALEMTRGEGLGIAEALLRQIEGGRAGEPAAGGASALLGRTADQASPLLPGFARLGRPALLPSTAATGRLESSGMQRDDFRPASREEFVREIWPLARRAGAQLGIDPRAIVAQAALETGWGSRLIRDGNGLSGNNVFGIKADSRWQGAHVTVTTLEYEDGLPKPQRAHFRAYPDLAAGFEDYVRFLKDNPRYREALGSGADSGLWAERLQGAGYATDPRYAEKLRGIMDGPALREALDALKAGGELPT